MTTEMEQPTFWATMTMGVTRWARLLFEEEYA
jgi:hypothetical protein